MCFLYLGFSHSNFPLFFFLYVTIIYRLFNVNNLQVKAFGLQYIGINLVFLILQYFILIFKSVIKGAEGHLGESSSQCPDFLSAFCKASILPSISNFDFSMILSSFLDKHIALSFSFFHHTFSLEAYIFA